MAGDEWLGRLLREKYRLKSRLESERYGPTYAAIQESTGTWHRILLLQHDPDGDAEISDVYTGRSAAMSLAHPRIVRMTEVGVQHGQQFVVSDLVQGTNLGRWLARRHREAELHIAGWLHDIAGALDCAHENGIVHLDLQPSSIVIRDRDLVALVAGFGHRIGAPDVRVLGASDYSAPEQWRHDVALIGPASDVYMVSAILFELVAGQPPFGNGPQAMGGHLDRPVPELRTLRPDLESASDFDRVLAWGLAKAPSDRPQTVGALVDAFTSALGIATTPTSGQSQQTARPPEVSTSRVILDPIVVGGIVIALAIGVLWFMGR
jgi:serine/threonine-protein kinase